MAMNFAPYQSSPPESERAKSPPPARSPTASPKPQHSRQNSRNIASIADQSDPWAAARNQRLPNPSAYEDLDGEGPQPYNTRYNDYIGSSALEGGGATTSNYREGISVFETSLGLPLNIEAALAYLLLPPAGGVVLLLFEHKSDYVRFHAWQSALLFSGMFLVHVIFSWTRVISWILFVGDLGLIAWLSYGAFRNAETLDRVEVPILGRLASSFVDDE